MTTDTNRRPVPDQELITLATYATENISFSELAYSTARYCLLDALGCALLALNYPACTRLLGPIVPGSIVPHGARVPGTPYVLDPIQTAFNIGTLIRWLDFNDTWLAAEWGHPSDNLGAILAVADYISQQPTKTPLLMRDVLTAMIKAYEIQGVLALQNSFNRMGLDHVILVKIASAAVIMPMLGGTMTDTMAALSHVFLDGQSLRAYRHAPNTGPRKSWAAGDATSRAVCLAFRVLQGDILYPSAISANTWGFSAVSFHQKPIVFARPLSCYVIENILFKIAYPAEFHAQTAVECAVALHHSVQDRIEQIEKIVITTHESALRIISKTGMLYNPADRDHCLQYIVAIALLHGKLTASDYEESVAMDPRIDFLRDKMHVIENPAFSRDYLDPEKRSIANALQIYFNDGTSTEKITVEYPMGHRLRRETGIPLLLNKFEQNAKTQFADEKIALLMKLFSDLPRLENMPVDQFMDLWT